jgi:hypothetical protein
LSAEVERGLSVFVEGAACRKRPAAMNDYSHPTAPKVDPTKPYDYEANGALNSWQNAG